MITGRIIRVLSGFYTVHDGNNAVVCKARGKFRKDDLKPLVGDICDYTQEGNNEGASPAPWRAPVRFWRKHRVSPPRAATAMHGAWQQAMTITACQWCSLSRTGLMDE